MKNKRLCPVCGCTKEYFGKRLLCPWCDEDVIVEISKAALTKNAKWIEMGLYKSGK